MEFVVVVNGNAMLVVGVLLGYFSVFVLCLGNAAVEELIFLLFEQSKYMLDMAFGFGTPVGSFGFGGLLTNFVGNVCCGWARAIKLIVLEERTE